MRAHRPDCGWFWTWAAVGAGLVLSFIGIFSVVPFLIPFVTLLLGVAATRRARSVTILVGVLVALAGITAAAVVTRWAFLATPLLTLAIGLAPAVPRSAQDMLRTLLIGWMPRSRAPSPEPAWPPRSWAARPPACLLLVAAGLAAFPLMRAPAGPRPLSR